MRRRHRSARWTWSESASARHPICVRLKGPLESRKSSVGRTALISARCISTLFFHSRTHSSHLFVLLLSSSFPLSHVCDTHRGTHPHACTPMHAHTCMRHTLTRRARSRACTRCARWAHVRSRARTNDAYTPVCVTPRSGRSQTSPSSPSTHTSL